MILIMIIREYAMFANVDIIISLANSRGQYNIILMFDNYII